MNQKAIDNYLKGTTSARERDKVMEWIEKEERNKKDFLELRKLYDISVWNATPVSNKTEKKRSAMSVVWRVAAISLVIVSLGLGYLLLSKEETRMAVESITCPQGQRLEFMLSDGTKVWLNSNSVLSFRKGENRIVELDGEAYFDVTPDKKNPFIVRTETHDITVLGTSFNVFAYKSSGIFECSLIEGVVSLKDKKGNNETQLRPNERLRFSNGILAHSLMEPDEEFLWKEGIYSFRNQPLSEVFAHLSLLHEVSIVLNNTQVGKQMCTGKFRNKDGIDHILSTLRKNYGFSYTKDEHTQTYVIY